MPVVPGIAADIAGAPGRSPSPAIHRPNHHLIHFLILFSCLSDGHGQSGEAPAARAGGEPVWPPPIWLMRQAGRYLPEYRRAIRTGDFIALCTTPGLAAELTLQPIRRYGFDAAILFSDLPLVPWALGQGLEYREGEGPVLPPLRDEAALNALRLDRMAEAIAPILETVRLVRAGLADEGFADCALIGFAGAPFTVACYIVEGRRLARSSPRPGPWPTPSRSCSIG